MTDSQSPIWYTIEGRRSDPDSAMWLYPANKRRPCMADVLSSSGAGVDKAPRRDADWLSPKEFVLLESICETFFPSLEPPSGSSEDLATFYRLKASDVSLASLVSDALSQEEADKRAEVHLLFSLLNSPILGMLLIGKLRRFVDL